MLNRFDREEVCKALCVIEKDKPNALCYNYQTGKTDTPAWIFREIRVIEAIQALEKCGFSVVRTSVLTGGLA